MKIGNQAVIILCVLTVGVPLPAVFAQNQKPKGKKAPEAPPVAKPVGGEKNKSGASAGSSMSLPLAGNKKAGAVEIDSKGALYYDAENKLVIFTKDVYVKHPQFDLNCDKLEVYLSDDSSGLKRAVATTQGNKRAKIVKHAAVDPKTGKKGSSQYGYAQRVDYDAKKGDVVLRGWPIVEKGLNRMIATRQDTVIWMKGEGGDVQTIGPVKVELIQDKQKGGKKKSLVNFPK